MENSIHGDSINYFAAILAGGTGKRMKISDLPKQFLMLKDRPIMIHTLEKFLLMEEFEAILLGMNGQWMSYAEDLIHKYIDEAYWEKIILIEGGESRSDTLEKLLDYLESHYEINEQSVLMTHDAVRPFVSLRILRENLEMSREHKMIDTAIPSHDTVAVSRDGTFIDDIPKRSQMLLGQTPQTFNIKAYRKHYRSLSGEEVLTLTDACKVFVLRNDPVVIVRGDEANLKITTVKDLKLARALLEEVND